MNLSERFLRPLPVLVCVALLGAGGIVVAQIEGGDRGVAPIDSSSSYEVSGVTVDVEGRNADEARYGGWREAQRRGWKMLWGRVNGQPPAAAPGLPDSTLDSIVGGIVVEDEQIGPRRYIARLGILFDRARAGALLGVHGGISRSAPMLVIPVQWSGATPTSFEQRTEWQKAWARFRTGGSPIDYVRPSGTGVDPLLLNVGQTGRPGRSWWRLLLDQYGAADVVSPEVWLTRAWPGGPITGRFVARHGPDNRVVDEFTLRVADADALPRMMDEGVRRIDEIYARALQEGRLSPDSMLVIEQPTPAADEATDGEEDVTEATTPAASTVTVEVETPDAAALSQAEAALRGVPGVQSVSTTSLALGGTSIMRIAYDGDVGALRIGLAARGWNAEDRGGGIAMRRGGAAPPAAPPAQ